MARVFAVHGMARHIPNRCPDYKPGQEVKIDGLAIARRLNRTLDAIIASPGAAAKPSVYNGAAGIAYSLCHVLNVPEAAAHLDDAPRLASAAVELADRALAYYHHHPGGVPWSLLFGEAGAHLVAAVASATAARAGVTPAADLLAAAERHVERYIQYAEISASSVCQDDDILYGRAGYLTGCLLLNDYFGGGGDEAPPLPECPPCGAPGSSHLVPGHTIEALAGAILRRGAAAAAAVPPGRAEFDTPLWWEWHGAPYLGAAHGAMGILHTLLHVPAALLEAGTPGAGRRLRGAVDYVLSLECDAAGVPGPGGEWPTRAGPPRDREPLLHWCHGAPGAVFLFSKAFEVWGEPAHAAAAARGGEAVWRRGLLRKGPGLCHGVSGNAYALLRLHRASGDPRWLHRAVQFAEFEGSGEFAAAAATPDHPLSLFEGVAGEACLLADLLAPGGARFPLYELE